MPNPLSVFNTVLVRKFFLFQIEIQNATVQAGCFLCSSLSRDGEQLVTNLSMITFYSLEGCYCNLLLSYLFIFYFQDFKKI